MMHSYCPYFYPPKTRKADRYATLFIYDLEKGNKLKHPEFAVILPTHGALHVDLGFFVLIPLGFG